MDGTCGGGCGSKGRPGICLLQRLGTQELYGLTSLEVQLVAVHSTEDTGVVRTDITGGAVRVAVHSTEETSEKQPSTS